MTLLSVNAYAAKIGKHPQTVCKWCRDAMNPETAKPRVSCRKVGRDYEIALEETERLHSQVFGSPLHKKLSRK